MYEKIPTWTWLVILLGVYLFLQIVFNILKTFWVKDERRALLIGFISSIVSYLWLISAVLVITLTLGYELRAEVPQFYPDFLLIIIAFLICFVVSLVDFYVRMVIRRKLGQTVMVDAEEGYFLTPTSVGAWELAFFNLAILKPFAYELFVRGIALVAFLELTNQWNVFLSYLFALILTSFVEFMLKPRADSFLPILIISAILSIVFLASSGGIISTIIVRVSSSILLSLYFMHLVFKLTAEGKDTGKDDRQ